ncbi:MAG: Cof-type HAD-IIB family hydrolase [Treponema sp.]|jgi:Cof subfamily protein (haloacid dehalogenase superfamily)|nr:Cof-type HAD-IIB family hydrolase [Treponema sp.]
MGTTERIRLIAFDLDGTVLNSQKEVSPRTREAIGKAKATGIYIVPATGRQFNDVHPLLKDLADPYVIANNGAQLFSVPGGSLVFSRNFEKDAALSLLREIRNFDALIFGAYDTVGFFDNRGKGFESGVAERMIQSRWKNNYPLRDIETEIRNGENFIKLVMLFENIAERERAYGTLAPRKDLYVTFFAEDNIELMPAGISKGEALKTAAAKLGIPMTEVMAIGDSDNDREMIREAGIGVAMGNALDTVKAEADRITGFCDEDGAAAAIESVTGPVV